MRVINIINKSLEHKGKKVSPKRGYFFISEAGKTPYEIFKSMNKKHISPRMQRVFDNGNDVHDRIRKYLRKQGVIRGIEVRIKTILLHGRADAIIYADGKIAVLEIKSIKKDRFEKLKKYGTRKAYLQTQLYMHFLKINNGTILFECKDDQRLKEFQIKRKPRVAKEQIEYFSRLKNKFIKCGVMAA